MSDKTPKSMRIQIAVFGRTNVGKSSFINMLAGQDVSVVSSVPGTTTDVVEKVMEFRPVGPVVFLDTAGMDDVSVLANDRIRRTEAVFGRADVFVIVTEEGVWGSYEERLAGEAKDRGVPLIAVVNKVDLKGLTDVFKSRLTDITPYVMGCSCVDAEDRVAIETFRKSLTDCTQDISMLPQEIVSDLLPAGGLAVLVIPIDSGAPKGRLILPQVQTVRDILDGGAVTLVVKDTEYEIALSSLNKNPDLVICDSQVIQKTAEQTPIDIPLTTFSVLFARYKGVDISEAVRGAQSIGTLKKGDAVLIAEACSHHAAGDDIGRVKIPNMLRERTGLLGNDDLRIDICNGRDYPHNLERYDLIIHCGACMLTRREMSSRISAAENKNVPITNYGMAISYFKGVLERVIKPFGVKYDQ